MEQLLTTEQVMQYFNARAIMGRFIDETLPYQKHEFDEQYDTKRVWTEFVTPRTTLVLVRVRRKLSLTRRKLPSKK